MNTPNTLPANGGVSDAEVEAAMMTVHGKRSVRIHWPVSAVNMRRALEAFAQSRQPSAQGIKEGSATFLGDGEEKS